MPRMRRKPSAQHRRLILRQRAATQPAPDRSQHRVLAHGIRARALLAGVTREESVAFWRGQVAAAGPTAGKRQLAEPSALASHQPQRHRGGACRQPIQRRPAREERPQRQIGAHHRRREMALELALAPVAHQLGQRDLHRTDALALAAERRGIRQMSRLVHADQRRRQHRAHRPGIHPAIRVSADRAIHRAVVHARGTADAAQHVLELGAQHRRAAVVQQHDVVLVRPVQIAGRRAPVENVV